jgi:carbamoylphosphate synthase large subunit
MKIRLVEAEFFQADRQTDGQTDNMTKLIVAFRNFGNALKRKICHFKTSAMNLLGEQ